ncbi:MAG: response regulator [Candidatus Poribacteria bacterium]|nr:response regulator [Candidatus Poribacteria bacterium]MDE0468239.1 response regulator [Candidatus Poribacteria bacterium]
MNEEATPELQETAKILVVDDEPRNVKILQIHLNARGYTVCTAADGLEALDIVEKEMPDLILLDINMPKMDGFEVVKQVRANEATEFIPIVMITALRDTRENRIKSIEAGADDFIEKPFDSVEVLARVRSLLRIKHYQDTLAKYNARLQEELQMARSIQEILIPQDGVQELSGFRVASHCCPEMAVGGDFFDVWEIAPNRLGVFISDVMGHGVSAAFVTVFIKTILAEFQQQIENDPGHLLEILNTRFNDLISSRLFMFATAFCGIIDLSKGELVCANAGHSFPLLYNAQEKTYHPIGDKNTGNGLGIWRDSVYETTHYPFDQLSRMFLYTDGVYEAKNPKGEEFTVDRLRQVVGTWTEQSAAELVTNVSEAIDTFTDNCPKDDDLTLIAIEVSREN